MTAVLDAGALIAIERADAKLTDWVKREVASNRRPITHAGVVGQVWRGGGGKQARLARVLQHVRVASLDDELGRRAGLLLGAARTSDVIDAALVLVAAPGDVIYTSDPADIARLARIARLPVTVVPV